MADSSSPKPLVYVSVDEEHVASISDALGARGDFEVCPARAVSGALEQLETEPTPVCVLSDTRFSDGDWRELLEAVRGAYPTLPFILYPKPNDEVQFEVAFDAGVTGYLQQGTGRAHITDLCGAIQAAINTDRTRESLTERQKELRTIQEITTILESGEWSLRAMLYSIVQVIPEGFQHPDRTHARLAVDDAIAETDGFTHGETAATVRTTTTNRNIVLTVSVESSPDDTEPIIFPEEHEFLETIVTLLSGDIERRTYVERLEETENRFNQITENISEVVWITDPDQSEMIYVNPAYEDVWKRSLESLYDDPTSFLESVHPDDRERVERAVFEEQSRGTYDLEYRIVLPSGELRWIHDRGVPVESGDGSVYRIVGLSEDVTDRKEREQQLTVLDRVLRHNLRNDMNVIIGNAEEIIRNGESASAAHGQTIIAVAEELLDLANKQRKLSRLLIAPRDPKSQDIVDLIEGVCDPIEAATPTASIEISTSVAGKEVIRTTPHLYIALRELVENAIEHGGNGVSAVAIDATVTDSGVEICVSDNGSGIPLEEQAVLESGESQLIHGSGLGLWLVHWVVTQAGGSVSFEPNEEEGTTVTLWLPHVPEAA